ncbi:MAG TPA: hypothetical protein VFB44_11795 [Thermoleophilaceae bacterium]|nr:hypothetical protein [Thermoleophilaceae bacterium]
MTATTQTVRDQAFRVLECDVPDGLTLREWSARRAAAKPGRRRRSLKGRRR